MMLRILFLTLFAYTFVACGSDTNTTTAENTTEEQTQGHSDGGHEELVPEGDGVHFGLEITPDGGATLADVISKVDAGTELVDLALSEEETVKALPTKVVGKVSEVCKSAGCWLTIATEDGKEMFITTNHEFFVPVSIVGQTVVVDGSAYKSVTTVEELKHYAEDDNKTPEEIAQITEPKSEYKLLAKGLVLKQ